MKNQLKNLNLTRQSLAEKTGLTRQTVGTIINANGRAGNLRNLLVILDALNMSLSGCGYDIGDKLRHLRQKKNISQKELAKRMGVSCQTVREVEKTRGLSANLFSAFYALKIDLKPTVEKDRSILSGRNTTSMNTGGFARPVIDYPDPKLPRRKYSIIYTDPPWHMAVKKTKKKNEFHYPTLKLEEMLSWDVEKICYKDCLMFMWVVSSQLPDAIRLGEAWGFKYSTVAFVWDKQVNTAGIYTMGYTELCLVFKRGKMLEWRGSTNEKQLYSEKRGDHSVKPLHFRESITKMYPTLRKLEMFARMDKEDPIIEGRGTPRDVWETQGWEFWGNETQHSKHDKVMHAPSDDFMINDKPYDKRRMNKIAEQSDAIKKRHPGSTYKPKMK